MQVLIRVDTAAKGKGATYHLRRQLNFRQTPVPIIGDTVYVNGVFLTIRSRCLTPRPDDDDCAVEIFATVDFESFQDLERAGWKKD